MKEIDKVETIELDILEDMWYSFFDEREILCRANREGTEERKSPADMAWRGKAISINGRCRDKIKSGTMVGVKEEV